ncbi:MAG: hypothetical protein JAZ17_08010, partial [Candidatus Thiodiazotropha endolucinida]|nr:hypothetical protein [Candidatus Thiodiazotropha endolucinida]
TLRAPTKITEQITFCFASLCVLMFGQVLGHFGDCFLFHFVKVYTYIRNYTLGLFPLTSSQPAKSFTSVSITHDHVTDLDACIDHL